MCTKSSVSNFGAFEDAPYLSQWGLGVTNTASVDAPLTLHFILTAVTDVFMASRLAQ
jgi:hypothetical protein